ncbi:hypothetical protein LTR10_008635 [Elasticomyces elasticus]|nr:hypothetical protein LTR10_008635 [Elasticomyces elasticus]KAK4974389.1 hypothetical protein LTR42_005033 [Elasticomyces elasticus]
MSALMTPIKIRGKRGALPAEKWHAGKKRSVNRNASPAVPNTISNAISRDFIHAAATSSQKRRKRDPTLSALEQLPVEIIQDIYHYSTNLDLPLASATLQAQLSSPHMYSRLTTHVLQDVLGYEPEQTASDTDLAVSARLFGCRFMTWAFFSGWLDDRLPVDAVRLPADYRDAWNGLKPARNLLPPQRLLHGPWTAATTALLSVLSPADSTHSLDLPLVNPLLGEVASEGALQAIAEGSYEALELLLSMGVRPTTEMFRQVVIDNGCDRKVLDTLHAAVTRRSGTRLGVDPLDPTIWQWAERAQHGMDDSGDYVINTMRQLARDLS